MISGRLRSIIDSMVSSSSLTWKATLALLLALAIFASAYAQAPRRSVPRGELQRLVLCAIGLYAVGGAAFLTHHLFIAAMVYAAGISVCALAAWLSRGGDSEEPPRGQQPEDEDPPPEPEETPRFDWAAFEREFRAYSRREGTREPASRA